MTAIRSAIQPAIRAAISGVYGSSSAWSPLTLFAASEVGVWYDPSDFSTMYQDSAGTTPVTAVGQPVGLILDKSKELVLGSEALTNPGFDTDTGWTKGTGWTISGGVATQAGAGALSQLSIVTAGKWYRVSVEFTSVTASGEVSFQFNAVNQPQFVVSAPTTVTQILYASASGSFGMVHRGSATWRGSIDNFSVKELAGNHAYQATAASRPILRHDGTNYYLEFDGVDDSLATAAINFTATDAVGVFAGIRKASDAARGTIVELTASAAANNGSFHLAAPNAASATIAWESKGTVLADAVAASGVAAPLTAVLTGTSDISGDTAILRVNGAQADADAGDQGTGNFSNAAMYIGRRGGSSLPFNGRIHSLVVLGRTATAGEITSAESYVAGKTGVTL